MHQQLFHSPQFKSHSCHRLIQPDRNLEWEAHQGQMTHSTANPGLPWTHEPGVSHLGIFLFFLNSPIYREGQMNILLIPFTKAQRTQYLHLSAFPLSSPNPWATTQILKRYLRLLSAICSITKHLWQARAGKMTQWLSHWGEIEPPVSFCGEPHRSPVRASTLECALKGEEPASSKVKAHLLGRSWASRAIKAFLVFFHQELFGPRMAEHCVLHPFPLWI